MRTPLRLAAPTLLGLTLAACSSTSSNNISDSCGRLFDAQTAAVNACGATVPSSLDTSLRPNFIKACVAGSTAPGSSIGPSYLEACISALGSAGCTDPDDIPACRDVPAGTLPNGGGCSDSSQCASTRCGNTVSGSGADAGASTTQKPSYCGVCLATLAEGDTCSTTMSVGGTSCARGLECRQSKCQKRVLIAEGQSCVELVEDGVYKNLPCVSGTLCDVKDGDRGVEGTCKKPPAKGQACTGFFCGAGLICRAGICDAREGPTSSSVDGPCGGTSGAGCADGLTCVVVPDSEGLGTCKARIAEGGACKGNDSRAPMCQRYLTCLDGTCQVEDANRCR
jgi:hypothetical protein